MAVVEWEHLTYLDLASLDKEKTVIVIPLGSLEIHGPHMPLGTDAFIAYKVAINAAEKSPPAVVLPPLFYTYVPENRHFPGAVSLSGSTFLKLLEEVCDEIYRNGFKRILVLNAHGGNRRPLSLFVREMQEKGKPYLLYAWIEPWKAIQDVIERVRETEPIEHACEIETSIGLHLFPELCKLERVKGPAKLGVEKVVNGVQTMVDWVSYAIEGYVGDPRAATKDKGKAIFEEWVRRVADLLEKIRNDDLYEKILMDFYSKAGY